MLETKKMKLSFFSEKVGRLYFQSSSEQVTKTATHHQRAKFSLKRFFKLKSSNQATNQKDDIRKVDKHGSYVHLNTESQAIVTKRQYRKPEVCQTEIDLSKSCIELVVHRDDGTIRRKKYREKKQRPVSCQVTMRENGSLLRSQSRQERPSSEYGYTLDYRKYRSYADSVSSTSKPIDFVREKTLNQSQPSNSHILGHDELNLLNSNPDGMKRHFSSPVCREPAQNTSPIDSTNSSGYHSNDVEKCLSPPMPTPNEIRNLTRRITEIQRQTSAKRFVRYNSLPNYRLNHIPETEEE